MPSLLTCTIFSLIGGLLPVTGASHPSKAYEPSHVEIASVKCTQPAGEQAALITEAEANQYTTRRVEFLGNRYTRDMVLRRRFVMGLQEGDLFTRRNLNKALRNVSKLKMIYPVRWRDVLVQLNRDEKHVDMLVCFREKRR